MSSVTALDIGPPDTFAEMHRVSHEVCAPQDNSGAVVALPNQGYAANNEMAHDTAPVAEINTSPCLTSDVNAVSLMPGVNPSNDPTPEIELEEVNPVPPGGMTPMLGIDSLTSACVSVGNMVTANEEQYEPVAFVPSQNEPVIQKTWDNNMSGPTPT